MFCHLTLDGRSTVSITLGSQMKIWKVVVFGLLIVLGVALVYPGIPVGSGLTTVNSATKLTCHYLHWTGLRSRVIDFGKATEVNDAACWSWK
jgi:hypothetical protein